MKFSESLWWLTAVSASYGIFLEAIHQWRASVVVLAICVATALLAKFVQDNYKP